MFHGRFGQLDESQLHQHSLLRTVADLIGQLREHPDVPHQRLRILKPRLLLHQPDVVLRHVQQIFRVVGGGEQEEISQIPDEIVDKLSQLSSLHHQLLQLVNAAPGVLLRHSPKDLSEHGRVHRTQDIQNVFIGQKLPVMEGHALVQQTQGIPHGSVRRPGDIGQGLLLHLDSLRPGEFLQPPHQRRDGDPFEIVSLAPGEHRDGNSVGLRGGEDEDHVGRRLLQSLQQGVESPCGEHMHLVDDVNPVFPLRGGILDLLPNLPDVLHAVVGGGVDLHHVQGGTA